MKDKKYHYDQTILKVYGQGDNKKIKVIRMNSLRVEGIEDEEEIRSCKGSVNDEKLAENILRAKNIIFEYAFCNEWDWFFTGTLDKTKYDRTNLDKYHKDLVKWFINYGSYHGCKIKFLLVPELHSDGESWHVHGFLQGLPVTLLKRFKVGDRMGKALADKVLAGDEVYNWPAYADKFGFCDLEPIRNSEAVSKYIQKYINKNLASSVRELNAHLYYHSRGLKRAEVVKVGSSDVLLTPTYENEFCHVSWLDYSDELLDYIADSIFIIDSYDHAIKFYDHRTHKLLK